MYSHSFTIAVHLVSSSSTYLSMADIGNRLGTAQLPALTDDNKILLKACVCTFAFDIANH